MSTTYLGEYGVDGSTVIEVQTVPGHDKEIVQLWRELDEADGPESARIIDRLRFLGAIRAEGQPE